MLTKEGIINRVDLLNDIFNELKDSGVNFIICTPRKDFIVDGVETNSYNEDGKMWISIDVIED